MAKVLNEKILLCTKAIWLTSPLINFFSYVFDYNSATIMFFVSLIAISVVFRSIMSSNVIQHNFHKNKFSFNSFILFSLFISSFYMFVIDNICPLQCGTSCTLLNRKREASGTHFVKEKRKYTICEKWKWWRRKWNEN
jgi:hypothetical protein